MQHAKAHRPHPVVAYVVLAAVLGLVSLTVSQCTQVADNLTGARLFDSPAQKQCKNGCNGTAARDKTAEDRMYEQTKAMCNTNDFLRQRCLEAEDERHDRRLEKIEDTRNTCNEQCERHIQGAGSAG